MIAVGLLFLRMLCDCFKPQQRLEAEILVLRHQLNVLQRHTPRRRLQLRWADRALFIWLDRRYPRILDAVSIVRPETVVRWHRKAPTDRLPCGERVSSLTLFLLSISLGRSRKFSS
jgi:hypothetical protein